MLKFKGGNQKGATFVESPPPPRGPPFPKTPPSGGSRPKRDQMPLRQAIGKSLRTRLRTFAISHPNKQVRDSANAADACTR